MEPLLTPSSTPISLTDALSYPFSATSRVAAATTRRRTAGSCVRAIRAPSLALAAPGSIPSGRYGGKGYGQRAARHRPAPADRLARRAVPGPAGRATPGTGDRRRPLQPHLRGPPQWTVDGAPPAAAGPRARHRPRHAPRVHGADRARPHAGTRPPHARLLRRPDRKSTRLNSSHVKISYAVFCLKKKKNIKILIHFEKKEKNKSIFYNKKNSE